MMRGSRSSASDQAAVASNACRLCDFAVTKNVPAKRLYGDIEPGIHHIITLERWSNGKLIYKKERAVGVRSINKACDKLRSSKKENR